LDPSCPSEIFCCSAVTSFEGDGVYAQQEASASFFFRDFLSFPVGASKPDASFLVRYLSLAVGSRVDFYSLPFFNAREAPSPNQLRRPPPLVSSSSFPWLDDYYSWSLFFALMETPTPLFDCFEKIAGRAAWARWFPRRVRFLPSPHECGAVRFFHVPIRRGDAVDTTLF